MPAKMPPFKKRSNKIVINPSDFTSIPKKSKDERETRKDFEERYEELKDKNMDLKILLVMAKWGRNPDEAFNNLKIAHERIIKKNAAYRVQMKGIDSLTRKLKDFVDLHLEKLITQINILNAQIKELG